jgi:hypothetical protein
MVDVAGHGKFLCPGETDRTYVLVRNCELCMMDQYQSWHVMSCVTVAGHVAPAATGYQET